MRVNKLTVAYKRCGGHIKLMRFKYYRMPRGHEHISFVFSKSLRNFLFLIKPSSILNSASSSRNVFSAEGLVTSLLCGSNTYSSSLAMFVQELCVYFEVIVRGKYRKEYLWRRPYYAAIPTHAFPTPLGKVDSNIFYSWFFILSFITKTYVFVIRGLTLFFNQIYLSLLFISST